jgi:tetratricopeptide (TPR) repeat protein
VTDAAEGADLLAEIGGTMGMLLWGALRDFMLWAEAPAEQRERLFGPGAGDLRRAELASAAPDQELWGPLLTLAQMADDAARADRARVVFAVRSLARWAERRGAPRARLAFARAAAVAVAADPRLALEAARLARDVAEHAQAETWFRRAITLSRGRDWETYVWGFIGLGVQYMRTGNYPAANAVMQRALRTARKRRLHALEGSAHHHLFVFNVDAGRMDEGYAHAVAALRAYGDGHPRLPALAHDLGCFWSEQGRFARALSIFDVSLPRFPEGTSRLLALANVVRAAAGVRERARYEEARAEAMSLAGLPACADNAAESLLLVAQGDVSLGEWSRAEAAARAALTVARERDEARTLMAAEAQLEAAVHGRALARSTPAETVELARRADELAAQVRASLTRAVGLARG